MRNRRKTQNRTREMKLDDAAKESLQRVETPGKRWSAIQNTVKKAPRGSHARTTAAGTPDAGRAGSRQEDSGPAKTRASRWATPRRWRTTPDHHAGAQQGAGAGAGPTGEGRRARAPQAEGSGPAPRRRNLTAATKRQRTTRDSDTEAQGHGRRRRRPRRSASGLSGAGGRKVPIHSKPSKRKKGRSRAALPDSEMGGHPCRGTSMTPRPEGWHRGIMRRKSSPCRHNTLYCRTPSLRGTGAGTDGAPGVGPLLRGGRIGTVPILRVPRPARTNERPRRTERAGTGDGPGDEGAEKGAGVAWSESRWIMLPRARRPATGPTDASDPGRLSAADRAATASKEDRTAEGPAGQAWDRKGQRIRAGRWRSPSASRGALPFGPRRPGPSHERRVPG